MADPSNKELAAAKRRASFGRSSRLTKEAKQKAERAKIDAQRTAEREKADQARKADALKRAEQRAEQSRKQAEQRRLQRHKDELRRGFNRQAEDRKAVAAQAERQRLEEAARETERKRKLASDQKQREAEAQVTKVYQRQTSEQQAEHRRQTHRLRAEQQNERTGFRNREAGGIILHASKIRNIDLAERRDLEALDSRRRSLTGRVVGLVRGAKHYDRQKQAIVERHEEVRWQKHREHEARKETLFQAEQAARLRQVSDRHGLAQRHRTERVELARTQEQHRPELTATMAQALRYANENQQTRTHAKEQERRQDTVRPSSPFNQAAERVR